eukprot:2302665-Amphidinium_carterae.2
MDPSKLACSTLWVHFAHKGPICACRIVSRNTLAADCNADTGKFECRNLAHNTIHSMQSSCCKQHNAWSCPGCNGSSAMPSMRTEGQPVLLH